MRSVFPFFLKLEALNTESSDPRDVKTDFDARLRCDVTDDGQEEGDADASPGFICLRRVIQMKE